MLQKLGKADETKDEQFEQVVVNFRRQEVRQDTNLQRPCWRLSLELTAAVFCLCVCVCVRQSEGSRLQREMKAYMVAIKGEGLLWSSGGRRRS